jgi:hypothetical protein
MGSATSLGDAWTKSGPTSFALHEFELKNSRCAPDEYSKSLFTTVQGFGNNA